ncbi:hypothetical protein FALCPG4_000345 [Fusarium falciforme]
MMAFWNSTIMAHFQDHRATNRPPKISGGIRIGATWKHLVRPPTGRPIAAAALHIGNVLPAVQGREMRWITIAENANEAGQSKEGQLARGKDRDVGCRGRKRLRLYDMFARDWARGPAAADDDVQENEWCCQLVRRKGDPQVRAQRYSIV